MKNDAKNDFIQALSKRMGVAKEEAGRSFDHCIEALRELLLKGGELTIPGFGKFMTKEKKARTMRHPQTGQSLPVEAKVVPVFKPGAALKMKVNNALRPR